MWDQVKQPDDRFSHNEAQIKLVPCILEGAVKRAEQAVSDQVKKRMSYSTGNEINEPRREKNCVRDFRRGHTVPVHYTLPEYYMYVCQCLAEMHVLKT